MTAAHVCPPDHPHGSAGGCYGKHHCRCQPCRNFVVGAGRSRRRAIAYGTWVGRQYDLDAVAAHVADLRRRGFTFQAIATVAGVDHDAVNIDRRAYMRRETMTAILAVTFDQLLADDRLYISTRGSQRRIRALATKGWTQVYIGARIGVTQAHIATILVDRLTPTHRHRAIAALYEELWNTAAPRSTKREKIAYSRVTRHAAARGWLPPLAWDDIDLDEDAPVAELVVDDIDQVAVELAAAGQRVALTPLERRAAVRSLHARQLGDRAIAERIGCAQETVQRIRAELGLPAALGADGMRVAS